MSRHPVPELLPRFSLGCPVTVLVAVLSLVVLGIVAGLGIPIELVPSGFSNPFLAVSVPWRDAPAREVLDKIVIPLEDELATVRGLDHMSSMAATGQARVFLSFKSGTDMDVAYREVRDRVQRARLSMPDDADRVFIRKEDQSGIPVVVLGLVLDPGLTDPYDLVRNVVVVRLERLDGVASVDTQGMPEKEIRIELDRRKVEAAGLDIYRIARDLQRDDFTLSSGTVYEGGRKLLLRSVARFHTVEALRRRLIASNVRLGDVAKVVYEEPDRKWSVRVDGRPAVALMIMKEGGANTMDVSRRIAAEVERMRHDSRLEGVRMQPIFDQGKVIRESLDTLYSSGKVGALFAIAVLLFFLRRFRMTLIITLSIPLSILAALVVMYFWGESLNVLSLLGLMISVGLLVDNSVVVAENIHRLHTEGLPPRKATIQGTAEIALAITMATLTTIIVFLPVSLVGGQARFFLLRLSIPVSVSLLGSLLVAGIVVPLAVFLTLAPSGPEIGREGRSHRPWPPWVAVDRVLRSAYAVTFDPLNRAYGRMLGFFLRRRLELVLLLAGILALTGAVAFKHVHFVQNQQEDAGGVDVFVRLPSNTTFPEAQAFFRQCEQAIDPLREKLDLSGVMIFHRSTSGSIQCWFNEPRRDPKITPRIATEQILEALPEKPGVKYYAGQQQSGGDAGRRLSEMQVTLYGENPDRLETVAKQVETMLTAVPGVLGLKSGGEPPPGELELEVDRKRARDLGVEPAVVAGVVGAALRGRQLPYFRKNGREIPVRITYSESDRQSLAELRSFLVPTAAGTAVPVDALTRVRFAEAARRIWRRNRRIARTIVLELEEGRERQARMAVMRLVSRLDLPEGITVERTADWSGPDEEIEALRFAAMLSVAFVYLLMGFLFESFILPLSVILTIPLAAIGVVWAHRIAGLDIDPLGMVGAVLLIGIVVNNGIVLIDAVNQLRTGGHARREAILLAARRRFRPIMMTALTTIFGLIPVALTGRTSIGLSYTSFGLTLISGLTTATALTLLVVPVFYTLFDDLRSTVTATIRHALANPHPERPDPAQP